MYHRYKKLWTVFFESIGCRVITSGPTTQQTLNEGSALAIDEACLSMKLFLGHVNSLVGRCDYIFIPRLNGYGYWREVCPRFAAVCDIAENTFRGSGQKFLSCTIDGLVGETEEKAVRSVAHILGYSERQSKEAYGLAKKEYKKSFKAEIDAQNKALKSDGLKIIVAGHSYICGDAYTGNVIFEYLLKNKIIPLRADVINHDEARRLGKKISETCKWEYNREILGGIEKYRKAADGLILVSSFPCGADAMVNELIMRRVKDMPILNIVLDGQSGTAGLETRLESFIDIIRFKGEAANE